VERHRPVIGTGEYGRLPVMEELKREAQHAKIDLIIRPTPQAFHVLQASPKDTNASLQLTR
jgi:hypothetical protein